MALMPPETAPDLKKSTEECLMQQLSFNPTGFVNNSHQMVDAFVT
jgi:hypothetical protein